MTWVKKILWWLLIAFFLIGAVLAWRWYKKSLESRKREIRNKKNIEEVRHKTRIEEATKEESNLQQAIWAQFQVNMIKLDKEEAQLDKTIEGGPVELAKFWNHNLLGTKSNG